MNEDFIPLLKFPLKGIELTLQGRESIILENNQQLCFQQSNTIIPLKDISETLYTLIIDIIRNMDNNGRYTVTFLQTRPITAKVFISTQYINELCRTASMSPKFLSDIIIDNNNFNLATDYTIQTCTTSAINTKQPPYIALRPYEYQKNNIAWMHTIESRVNMSLHQFAYIRCNDLKYLKTPRMTFYLEPRSKIIYNQESIWNTPCRTKTLTLKGAVIADEMGLGKTYTVISLILEHKFQTHSKSRILVCKKDELPQKPKQFSRATIVLCPRRLVAQWMSEIYKYTTANFRSQIHVIELSTVTHIKKYTYSALCSADIIVISFSLLQNKSYEGQEDIDLLDIEWQRIVVDEGHEILLHDIKKLDDVRIANIVFSLKAHYKWVCTGTPLPFGRASMDGIISFLTDLPVKSLSDLLSNLCNSEMEELKTLLFRRNTKESTQQEISIPPPIETTDFLEFSPIERTLYNAAEGNTLRQMQLCTNILISDTDKTIIGNNPMSLDQVSRTMAVHYRTELEKYETVLTETVQKRTETAEEEEKVIGELDLLIIQATDPKDLKEERTKEKHKFYGRKKTLDDKIENTQSFITLTKNKIKQFISLDTQNLHQMFCPVLNTQFQNDLIAISPHGHCFSYNAILMLFNNRKTIRCPYTGTVLTQTDFLIIDLSKTDNKLPANVAKWGTKMAHLIQTLHNIFEEHPENRVIVFSQWKVMLDLVGMALKEAGIQHVFCRGNVHVMSKSIHNFKHDKNIKVLLLSSESCSSGSNLTEASHIILLDTVNTTPENARAIESQAICRATRLGQQRNVVVKRFIIKDTIEEEYYFSYYHEAYNFNLR